MTGAARAATAALALAVAGAALAADADIALLRFGVGSHARPGDPTAILVRATSNLREPVQARIEWLVRDADGDVARYSRDVALAPGAPVERWVYGVLPIAGAGAQRALDEVTTVQVVQTDDGRPVRVLGERRVDGAAAEEPGVGVEVTESLIGVVGDGRAGLAPLSVPTPDMPVVASMNELTRIARGLDAAGLPDRWEGLASYETIVWTNAPVRGLGAEQAKALLDWVRRGGNLVIVLPESGDPWGVGGRRDRTPLGEALPAGAMRHEGVRVSALMPVLSRGGTLRNGSAETAVWTFDPAAGGGFVPLLLAPGRADQRSGHVIEEDGVAGKPVAVRKPMGFGFVTVLGIDADGIERRQLTADGLPHADAFWNRILGRRADAPTPAEWAAFAAEKRLDTRGGTVVPGNGDGIVNRFVGLQSRAALGVLGLLAAFAAYWAIAGPGSHYLLRATGRQRQAWLGFVAVAAAATAVAWVASGLFQLSAARVQHLTFVDRVEDGGAERPVRAQSWMGAALPGYGSARVTLARDPKAPGGDLLCTWFPPPSGNAAGFPDTETYLVPAEQQADRPVPARATATVLSAHWVGTPPAAWDGTPREMPERRLRQDIAWGQQPTVVLYGALVHSLPGPLTDVRLIHVNPFHTPGRTTAAMPVPAISPSGLMPSYARMAQMESWAPNAPLDIGPALYADEADDKRPVRPGAARDLGRDSAESAFKVLWYDPLLRGAVAVIDPSSAFNDAQRLDMLQLYDMLQPPAYLQAPDQRDAGWRGDAVRVERDLGRGLDLSRWFSTPCLIVIGTLADDGTGSVGMPIPFTIDGAEPAADGTTVVRVVFPLPSAPGAMLPQRAR